MEFRYSEELSAAENSTGGIAGSIPVRRHRYPLAEDIGALRAQEDWKKHVGNLDEFKGGLARKYGLMQVAVPECKPERLEIIAYASEIGFLYDDCTEMFGADQVSNANNKMQLAFSEGVRTGIIESKHGGLKAMQSVLFNEMVTIDKHRAITTMKVWIEFLEEAAGRQHDVVHTTFAAYMKYRVLDVGEMFWFGLVTFGMALTIDESELPLLRKLTHPCWIVLALQNDICSYNKEYDAACRKGVAHVVNALWVLMQEHGTGLDEARMLCVGHIDHNIARFQDTIAEYRNSTALSRDARTYLESLLYTISGDAVWSLITPRYNPEQGYNELQQSMQENGIETALRRALLTKSCAFSLSEKMDAEDVGIVTPSAEALAFQSYTNFE